MQELLDKYVKSGMRLTDQRRLIIEEIAIATDHPNVETLYRRVNEKDSGISLATVYRAVTALEQAGLLERLDIRDGKARYEVAGSHHDHLIDIDTGEIHEFYDKELEDLQESIAKKLGFELIDHRLELFVKRRKEEA